MSVRVTHSAGGAIRTFTVSLLGAFAVVAGVALLRQSRNESVDVLTREVPPGESVPGRLILERLRERGF